MEKSTLVQLKKILKAVVITSPASFSFSGRSFNLSELQIENVQVPNISLISNLQQTLYRYCFIQKFENQIDDKSFFSHPEKNILKTFSDANTTHERWETGWIIDKILLSGQVIAQRNGYKRNLWPGEFISQGAHGIIPYAGMKINIFFPKESHDIQYGFYYAFSETPFVQDDISSLVRYYWNVKASGITVLLNSITRTLNFYKIPFRFKCLSNSKNYSRLDSAVLYVNKRYYKITTELIFDIYINAKELLDSETPIFTKQLLPGLAIAEDPGNGESFGISRCRMIAQGVWSAYLSNSNSLRSRLEEISKTFSENKFSYADPYMNLDSKNIYN